MVKNIRDFLIILTMTFILWGVGLLSIQISQGYSLYVSLLFPVVAAAIVFAVSKLVLEDAKKIEQLKNDFITIAAHRLRTPVSQMNWMVEELSSDIGFDEKERLAASMKEVLTGLTDTINQLLDATEAGQNSLYYDYLFESGKIEQIVRQVIAGYSVGMMHKNIGVDIDIEDNLPPLLLDKERIKIAISIFVENAILYTPKGGRIEMRLYRDGRNVVFSIKDNGIGIPKKSLPYIYTKFYRTKSAVSADRDRAGLGLFIAKEIIERHGGKVGVMSDGSGKGSTFWFSIPIKQ